MDSPEPQGNRCGPCIISPPQLLLWGLPSRMKIHGSSYLLFWFSLLRYVLQFYKLLWRF